MVDGERISVVLPFVTHLRVAYSRPQLVLDEGFIGSSVCCGKLNDELAGIVARISRAFSAFIFHATYPVVAGRGHRNPCVCAFIPDPKIGGCGVRLLVYLCVARLDRDRRISGRVVEIPQRLAECDRCVINCLSFRC